MQDVKHIIETFVYALLLYSTQFIAQNLSL